MRKVTSLTLVISGLIELITSVVLYILPAGRVAYWADYHLLGLSKTQWGDVHITVGTLFLIMAVIHIYLNWRPIVAYIKNRARKITVFTASFNIALLLSVYVTIGTLYHLPPMNFVLQAGEYFTEEGNKKYGEPPYGHAELSSLKMFCKKMNIDVKQVQKKLVKAGIQTTGEKETIKVIAGNNDLTPQQLYEIIKTEDTIKHEGKKNFPSSPAPGFGKKSLEEICKLYNLPLSDVLNGLKNEGIIAHPGDIVKEVASSHDTNPMAIFEILQGVANTQ